MPRLNHKKARTGCQRCKARKVKCDELRPKCTACNRHNVPCEYVEPAPRKSEQVALPTPPRDTYAVGAHENEEYQGLDPRLEIRLMHEWTAYVCMTFSAGTEFWRYQAPLFALEHRMVLDAMFGLSALHFSRQQYTQYIPMRGRTVPLRDPIYKPSFATRDISERWKESEDVNETTNALRNAHDISYIGAKRSQEMLYNARMYFDRAIDGHRTGLANLTKENIEAVYLTSILVSFHALFTLGENEGETTLPTVDPLVWIRLASGTRYLLEVWKQMEGEAYLESIGVYMGNPKLIEETALYQAEGGKPFESLMVHAGDLETATPEDRDAYEKCHAYIAFVYKDVTERFQEPLAVCRCLVASASRLPKRFGELVEMRAPRALIMLAHIFAIMKISSDKIPWFQGLAERQVPKIYHSLPEGWTELMAWPMKVVEGKAETTEEDAGDIGDILSL